MVKATKARLLAKRDTTREVELPGLGTVTVRGLQRGEVREIRLKATKAGKVDEKLMEQLSMQAGLVEPRLTLAEVKRWDNDAPAGETVLVLEAIAEMSGMSQGADKSGLSSV